MTIHSVSLLANHTVALLLVTEVTADSLQHLSLLLLLFSVYTMPCKQLVNYVWFSAASFIFIECYVLVGFYWPPCRISHMLLDLFGALCAPVCDFNLVFILGCLSFQQKNMQQTWIRRRRQCVRNLYE